MLTAGGAPKYGLGPDSNQSRCSGWGAGSIRVASHCTITSRHGFLEGIESPERRPIQEITIPLSGGTVSGQGRLGRPRFEARVYRIVGVAGQRIEIAAVGAISNEVLVDGCEQSVRVDAAPGRIAGPAAHAA